MVREIPRAKVRPDAIDSLREYLTKDKVYKPPKAVVPVKLPKRIWRPLSTAQRLLIVRMRWSGLTFSEIGLMLKINQITCRAVYRSYYVNGQTAVKPRSRGRPASPIPPEVHSFLLDNLYESRFLSLRERVRYVQ